MRTPSHRIQRTQRTIRQARALLIQAQDATPELAAELGDAITASLAAERRSARLLREALERRP